MDQQSKQLRLYPRNKNPSLWITSNEIKIRGTLKRTEKRNEKDPITVSVDGDILAF